MQRAVADGVGVTGVSVAYTVLKMDAGPVVAQEEYALGEDEAAPEALEELFRRGTRMLLDALPAALGLAEGGGFDAAAPQVRGRGRRGREPRHS